MSKKLASLTVGLLLCGSAWAQEEPVVRVQSIGKVSPSSPSKLVQKRPNEKDGFPVTLNTTGYVKDHYVTDQNTLAALEFLIGGRVGINKDTDIMIVNERSIADGKTPTKRVVLKSGGLWVKADAKTLKQPLEIQTNGGVMGIKGTEFTVESQADGSSKVCCFESNSEIGGVEIRDNSGKVVGVAKPGDEYLVNLKTAPVVKHYENVEEFRNQRIDAWGIRNNPAFQAAMSVASIAGVPGIGLASGALYTADAFANCERDPAGATLAALSLANQAGANTGAAGSYLGWGASIYNSTKSNEPPKADYPTQLSPDNSPKSQVPVKTTSGFPSFSWKGLDDARSYVVMVAKDENLYDIVYTDQTQNLQLTYPSYLRPLPKGQYYWRVIPVNDEDKPIERSAQTYFSVE